VRTLERRTSALLSRRAFACLGATGLSIYALHTLTGLGWAGSRHFFDVWLTDCLLVLAVVGLAVRVVFVRDERAAWSALAVGLGCWAAGDIAFD